MENRRASPSHHDVHHVHVRRTPKQVSRVKYRGRYLNFELVNR